MQLNKNKYFRDILEEENAAKVKESVKIKEKGLLTEKEKTEAFQPIIVQNVTYIDKKSCAESFVDVKKLYQKGRMKK